MTFMAFSMVISILVPVVLFVYFHKKYTLSLKAVGIGALVWIIFTQVFEKSIHVYLLKTNPATAQFLNNPYVLPFYGALMAGIFEETGRYLAFRYVLKGKTEWKDGIAYGIGHGGIESIVVGMLLSINNLATAILINSGKFASLAPSASLEQIKHALTTTSPVMFALSGVERLLALAPQIALSLIVLYGIKTGKIRYLFYAILAHATLDIFAGMYQAHLVGVWVVEAIVAVFAVLAIWLIVRLKKSFTESNPW
jgi:uncharacterized membrane protein YhfC